MADDDYYDPSCSDMEEEEDCDYREQEDDLEETVLHGLEDRKEACNSSILTVITKESLLAAQKEVLHKVMDLLALSEHHARTLLIYYRWDVERIFDSLEQKGRDRLFSEAGVAITQKRSLALSRSSAPITCHICFEDVSPDAATTMDCGHYFCNDCWTEYFIVKINDGQSRRIRCMANKCNVICDEVIVRHLVGEKQLDLADRFDRFVLESYLEDNSKVKWCPSTPHCGNAIRVEGDIYCEVECTCGLQFCFSCLAEVHSPCSCLIWELWSKKCNNESENANWITANTKPCPQCRKPVQKISGCNLVSCICGQAFCWLCGDATGRLHTWTTISGHSCNRFKDDQHKAAELAKRNLDRYLHYYNRYRAHTDSLKQENDLKETMKEIIHTLESKESRIKDYSWLLNGLHKLFRVRRVLSFTYPFAFYMFGDELFRDEMTPKERATKKTLFEDLQEQLESKVEMLSMILQKDFQNLTDKEIADTRIHAVNLANLVDTCCKKMYQYIENDLLYPLRFSTHIIAPYKSMGLEMVPVVCWDSDPDPGSNVTGLIFSFNISLFLFSSHEFLYLKVLYCSFFIISSVDQVTHFSMFFPCYHEIDSNIGEIKTISQIPSTTEDSKTGGTRSSDHSGGQLHRSSDSDESGFS